MINRKLFSFFKKKTENIIFSNNIIYIVIFTYFLRLILKNNYTNITIKIKVLNIEITFLNIFKNINNMLKTFQIRK